MNALACFVLWADRSSAIDVYFLAPWFAGSDLLENGDKPFGRVPCRRFPDHASRPRVQRLIERERAVTVVLETVPLKAAGREGSQERAGRALGSLSSHQHTTL